MFLFPFKNQQLAGEREAGKHRNTCIYIYTGNSCLALSCHPGSAFGTPRRARRQPTGHWAVPASRLALSKRCSQTSPSQHTSTVWAWCMQECVTQSRGEMETPLE